MDETDKQKKVFDDLSNNNDCSAEYAAKKIKECDKSRVGAIVGIVGDRSEDLDAEKAALKAVLGDLLGAKKKAVQSRIDAIEEELEEGWDRASVSTAGSWTVVDEGKGKEKEEEEEMIR